MNVSGSGQFLDFFAKRSQSAFSVIHLGSIWIPGAFWNTLVISMQLDQVIQKSRSSVQPLNVVGTFG